MNQDYIRDLRLLKTTFDQGNEADVISSAISTSIPIGRLRLLDVGIGEGNSTFHLVETLTLQGYSVQITCLDVHLSERVRNLAPRGFELLECDFAALPLGRVFDVVICTQSLYYLGEHGKALRKLIAHTAPEGLLLVTIWTENCILYNLYSHFASATSIHKVTAEEALLAFSHIDETARVNLVRTLGSISIVRWLEAPYISMAAFRILSRSDGTLATGTSQYKSFLRYLRGLPPEVQRENGTIIAHRCNSQE